MMYVCMYVCMYACMYVCRCHIGVSISTHVCVNQAVCVHVYVYTCVHICILTECSLRVSARHLLNMYVGVYVCVCACMFSQNATYVSESDTYLIITILGQIFGIDILYCEVFMISSHISSLVSCLALITGKGPGIRLIVMVD
jgi:hypothetical protein